MGHEVLSLVQGVGHSILLQIICRLVVAFDPDWANMMSCNCIKKY